MTRRTPGVAPLSTEALPPPSFVRKTSGGLVTPTSLSGVEGLERQRSQSHVEPPPTRDPSRWFSPLERERSQDVPELPTALAAPCLRLEEAALPEAADAATTSEEVAGHFETIGGLRPLQVLGKAGEGAARAPRQLCVGVASVSNSVAAAGTHNVILGLRTFLDRPELAGSRLLGIRHLARGNEFEIHSASVGHFLNQGGSDLLPTIPLSRVTARILGQVTNLCDLLQLDGLLFLCGPSELSEVVKISEHLGKAQARTAVAVVVHSLSGWVRVPGWMPTNLGFDSACSVLAEVSGSIALSRSSLKFDIYHFLCIGSPPLTLEVALQIRPTLCYIGADVAQRGLTLQAICDEICDAIVARHHDHGLHSGVIMVSDDFLGQLVEMRELREVLHRLRLEKPAEFRSEEGAQKGLPPKLAAFFPLLPADVRHDLLFRNDMDGMPMLRQQEMERELGAMVTRNLRRRLEAGAPSVENFAYYPRSGVSHLAVSPMPTALDCALGSALGHVAGALLQHGANGYAASVRNMGATPRQWQPCAVPLARLLQPHPDGGAPTVRRRQITDDAVFSLWRRLRDHWRYGLSYVQPGPMQYWGPGGRPNAWMTYTLRVAIGEGAEEFDREVAEASRPDQVFVVPLTPSFRLVRRREALLSPLQRWRCTYQPRLPEVLRGHFRISEEDRKGRVCADPAILATAFPALWRTNNLKHVIIETVPDEVSVLQMLPERPRRSLQEDMRRVESWGARSQEDMRRIESWGARSDVSKDMEPKTVSSRSEPSPPSNEAEDLGQVDVALDLKRANLRVGLAIVGRAGPGMNNVVQGLHEYLKMVGGTAVCIAMGIAGLISGHVFELTDEMLLPHRNQGGCDLLGQSQPEDLLHHANNLELCAATCRKLELDGLVIWGGRNTHSWTANLAEYFVEQQVHTRVIGVPASVESDLPLIEQTLGHDTVCKFFGSIVGNLATQAASSGMQWCFIRIPGRSISHIAAEVALQTLPHVVLVSTEMSISEMGIFEVTQKICNVIEARSREEMNFGVVIIPDQFMAAVREMQQLFDEVQQIRSNRPEAMEVVESGAARDFGPVQNLLPPLSRALFQSFPERIRAQICSAKGEGLPKGAVDLSGIETEVIFQSLVETELTRRVVLGTYKGPFQCRTYSLPYHGRATMPTNFDCNLGYTIGYAAGIFVDAQRTGLLVDVTRLKEDAAQWEVGGIPLASLLSFQSPAKEGGRPAYEIRPKGRLTYDLGSEQTMPEPCERTLMNPGPKQFEGPCSGPATHTLSMPQLQRVRQMALTNQLITELKAQASAGCPPEVLRAVSMLLQGGVNLLGQL